MPKSVRQLLKLRAGDEIDFVEDRGQVVLRTRSGSRAVDLAGRLSDYAGEGVSLDEIDQAIGQAIAEDDQRIRRQWNDGRE